MIWSNSKADIYYRDTEADLDEPCEVRVDGNSIVVSYEDDGGHTVYKGIENGIGHFELSAPTVKGRASLHMFKHNRILEGYWEEDGQRGMWRIKLA